MAQYLALTYTADVDWWAPEQAEELAEYRGSPCENAEQIRASAVLHPTRTATVVRVEGARGGDGGHHRRTVRGDEGGADRLLPDRGRDLDEAVAIAAEIPAAWGGAVEVRPVIVAKISTRGPEMTRRTTRSPRRSGSRGRGFSRP